ncbi:TetR/AcrR family transcriptional regulator [Actinocorallia sp. API 0066]|uniref:TetR/AcrR family transcriptional regulator n=1 Tax=Actinocorallia sp. API 0066 TaxID=2896846 RepID=UPI001E40AF86|nr:TetR/AcrR family transcriptional regulator [Actinocorallia sp. API 0066]MCD0453187.1 TetR/AcrR family transcriptional regulator [Actinocorallia sp. API 0066]
MTGQSERKVHAGRQERRLQTRRALLEAARRLFAERGIHGASLDDVANAAGLTKGAVYSNFTGKNDLLLALLDHCADDDVTQRWIGAGEDDRQFAQLLVEFWLYGMRDGAAAWRIADWYQARRAALADTIAAAPGEEAGTAGTAGGDAKDAEVRRRATLALAMEMGLALQHLLDPDRVPAEVYRSGMDLVLGPTPTR